MSLEYAILGFLNYHPYTGYDLKKVFDKSVRHFWPADQSQIYRTLSRLMEQGHVYHITSAGRAALIEWLAGPPQVSEARSAVLIQVFFMGQLSNEEILKRFEGYTHIMKMVLDQYDQVPTNVEEIYTDVKSERERFFWMLTLENGICNMRANLEWAESVIERLKNGQVPEE
jgi:PadR family transcriptional regulator AphA